MRLRDISRDESCDKSRDKSAARLEIKRRLAALKPEDFPAAGQKAVSFFRQSSFWKKYSTFLLFMSTKTEIDTAPVFRAALADGKQVFLPRAEKAGLKFYRAENPEGPWTLSAAGIREPLPKKIRLLNEADFPALIFTPGLAFDRNGNRLGHGRAYYDRFFAALEKAELEYFSAGLCLECQVLPSVPANAWDFPVKYLGSF